MPISDGRRVPPTRPPSQLTRHRVRQYLRNRDDVPLTTTAANVCQCHCLCGSGSSPPDAPTPPPTPRGWTHRTAGSAASFSQTLGQEVVEALLPEHCVTPRFTHACSLTIASASSTPQERALYSCSAGRRRALYNTWPTLGAVPVTPMSRRPQPSLQLVSSSVPTTPPSPLPSRLGAARRRWPRATPSPHHAHALIVLGQAERWRRRGPGTVQRGVQSSTVSSVVHKSLLRHTAVQSRAEE